MPLEHALPIAFGLLHADRVILDSRDPEKQCVIARGRAKPVGLIVPGPYFASGPNVISPEPRIQSSEAADAA